MHRVLVFGGGITNSSVRVHIAKADYTAAQNILNSVGGATEPISGNDEEILEEKEEPNPAHTVTPEQNSETLNHQMQVALSLIL